MRTRHKLLAAGALLVSALVPSAAGAQSIDAYQSSWTHRALADQYELGSSVGMRDAPWVGTHNSFNSVAEMGPALSANDSNQKLKIVDQLRIDVRSLELDVHWFPSVQTGGYAPVVCHATGEHAGCTTEKPLGPVLDEIGGWLRDHRDQVLLLYLEDHLDTAEGYDSAAQTIEAKLGDLVYRPAGGGASCVPLPLDLTRDAVRAAGAQVVIVSGCGIGTGWRSVAFDWSSHKEARPRGYTDYPDCGPDFTRAEYDSTLIRYFEDSTRLTNTGSTVGAAERDDGITPATAAQMARCGVDLFGLDQLVPTDGRLDALVWSWAPGEPLAGGDCAIQRVDAAFPFGRWQARSCTEKHRVACRTPSGDWIVPKPVAAAENADATCGRAGAAHSVPRTGYENQLLRTAMEASRTRSAWLAYTRGGSGWGGR
jgi:hypothetical protein